MFADAQRDFSEALLDPERAVPRTLAAGRRMPPLRRFAVYRNNVVVGLVDALARRFPATQRIVGEGFFREMARVHVRRAPPRSPLLMFYGDDFPGFIEGFAPAAELDYLADVARLEAARTRAYHAADAVPAGEARFAAIAPRAREKVRIRRHPSAEIVRSAHPVVTIWEMNAGGRPPGPVGELAGEDALIVRPRTEVAVWRLAPGGGAFLQALFDGLTLGEAAETAAEACPDFDLVAGLTQLIVSGAAADAAAAESSEEMS